MINGLKLTKVQYDILEAKICIFFKLPIGVTIQYSDVGPDDNGDYWIAIKDNLNIEDGVLSSAERNALKEYKPVMA